MGRPPAIPIEKQAAMVEEYFAAGLSLKEFAEKKGIKKAEIKYLVKKYYRSGALLSDDTQPVIPREPVVIDPVAAMAECKRRRDAWKPPRHALWPTEGIDDGESVRYKSYNFFHKYTLAYH
jgi:hypothetical protein